jgi:triosephosphate isomerase
MSRRCLIAGNWKMNGLRRDGLALAQAVYDGALTMPAEGPEIVICPPATLLAAVAPILGVVRVQLGAQDCHAKPAGAFTGDVSAPMLAEAGCRYVIVGHSERRAAHQESDATVRAKAEAARAAGMRAIICVGETLVEREQGRTLEVLSAQIDGSVPDGAHAGEVVVAYEPVWAIGTGRVATVAQIAEAHRAIRARLARRFTDAGDMRVLYGGSVKAENAKEVLGVLDVDGALVGGASLDARQFLAIAAAAPSR